MATIRTKAGEFNGQVGAVTFVNGVAETSIPTLVAHFRRDPDRYAVEFPEADETEPEPDESPEDPEGETPEDSDETEHDGDTETEADPYDVNRSELRDIAKARGLSTSGNVAELQARLREADAEGQSNA